MQIAPWPCRGAVALPSEVRRDDDQAALRFAAAGNAALCTIVGIDGSFSRRLGAQLAIAADGAMAGSLADGCLERELAAQAEQARKVGAPRLLRYGRGSPFIDFRLPCGSGLDILVDPSPDIGILSQAVAALDNRRTAYVPLQPMRGDLLSQRRYAPELRVVALGSGPEALELARLAEAYRVPLQLVGPGRGLVIGGAPALSADRWTAVALLFHDHEWERGVLDWALTTPAFYIGALGGEVARTDRRAWLERQGHPVEAVARVRSPIGLIARTREARALALSVLAEIVATYEEIRR